MAGKIPWEIIAPAGALAVVILILVFGFILKMQKRKISTPAVPKDIQTMSKSSPCFRHERDIGSNTTAIGMITDQIKISNKNNSDAHEKLFDKIDELKTDIITEIHKANGG